MLSIDKIITMVKKALLIGINYRGQNGELNGCINDINSVRSILIDNCGYQAQNIKVLTDDTPIKPTKQNIEDNIKWLVAGVTANDNMVFYYSGHGAFVKDSNSDEGDGNDEVLVPLDYQQKGVIVDDWLMENMVGKVPQNATLWSFTDCCHSGTMLDLKFNYMSLCEYKKGNVVKNIPFVPTDWTDKFAFKIEKSRDIKGNIYLFSGCLDRQTSADAFIRGQSQGAFSFCFLTVLRKNLVKMQDGSTRFPSGKIKLRELLKEINCQLLINGFSGQNSQMSCLNTSDFERTLDL